MSKGYKPIKWSRSDTAKLSNAVRTFNKEVQKQMGNIDIKALPDLISYKEVKAKIVSRRDLDLALRTLKKIKNKNAFNLEVSTSNPNVKYIHWTSQAMKMYDTSHKNKMQKELVSLKREMIKNAPKEEFEGKVIVKPIMRPERIAQLEAYLDKPNMNMLESARDYDVFNKLVERMTKLAFDSSIVDRNKIYKQNYLKMLEETYSTLDNYEQVRSFLEDIPDKDFFDYMKTHDVDYNNFAGKYGQKGEQSAFNDYASKLGLDIEDVEYEEEILF